MTKGKSEFDLEDRLIDFAVRIIRTSESLPKSKVGKHIAGQLIRSGTSPAPNYGEAQSAESRSDFIHRGNLILQTARLYAGFQPIDFHFNPKTHNNFHSEDPTANFF